MWNTSSDWRRLASSSTETSRKSAATSGKFYNTSVNGLSVRVLFGFTFCPAYIASWLSPRSLLFDTVDTGKGWVGIARPAHVQLGASTHVIRWYIVCLSPVTCMTLRELPHFHHGSTSSFLYSQSIQAPPSGPGLNCAAGKVYLTMTEHLLFLCNTGHIVYMICGC